MVELLDTAISLQKARSGQEEDRLEDTTSFLAASLETVNNLGKTNISLYTRVEWRLSLGFYGINAASMQQKESIIGEKNTEKNAKNTSRRVLLCQSCVTSVATSLSLSLT